MERPSAWLLNLQPFKLCSILLSLKHDLFINWMLKICSPIRWSFFNVKNVLLYGVLKRKSLFVSIVEFHEFDSLILCLSYVQINVWPQASSRAWNKWFEDYISYIGFFQGKYGNSIFIYQKNTHMTHRLLYVENIILTTFIDDIHKYIISLLIYEFSMKDFELFSYILGILDTRYGNCEILG